MTRGSKTPAVKVAEFRAQYLLSRNASAAALKVGLNDRTGRKLAEEAEQDPEFSEACRKLRARYIPEIEAILQDCVRIAHKRIQLEPMTPKEQAELMQEYNLKSFSYPDPRPAYMAQIAKTATVLNQGSEKDPASQTQHPTVQVILNGTEPESDDGGSKG
jgi:hypothetical protein